MSKRQFRSQASSSRAASGVVFGGFGSSSNGSTLSYLTEPPNLSSINDANVVVGFKNLSKKDGTTKSKALEDLRTYVQGHPFEEGGGPEEAILEAWVKFYPRLSIDNSRRVRELSHHLLYEIMKAARKRMEKHLPKIVGSWLAGTYDRDRIVAKAAVDGVKSFMITEERLLLFWKRCQAQILNYAQEAINETPQTLSDERTLSADDVQAKYFRVVGSSISLIVNLLVKLDKEDIMKQQHKYEEFLGDNKKLWALAACEDAFVRRTADQLLVVCLDKQHDIIESDLEIVSQAFISEALKVTQTSSAFQLLQALEKLTFDFPHAWTSAYQGKKSPLSRLRHFVEKGSQGGPPDYWQALQSLLSRLPGGILPTDVEASLEFLKSFRDGIGHREEPKRNATQGWSTYFEVVRLYVGNLVDSTARDRLLQESVFPVFGHYLHPTTENHKWFIGNNYEALVKAFMVCASFQDPSLQQSFGTEWNRLGEDFISRILTSLPEQSKDYQKSQSSVATEGHRWFALLSKTLEKDSSSTISQFLILPSNMIISSALKAVVNRNGKPYSAAATVESALRLSPKLMFISPAALEMIKAFLEAHLAKLILSASSSYLVSMLNILRSIPDQQSFTEDVWQATVDGLLPLPNGIEKLKAVTALISNNAVSALCQADAELQDYLLDTLTRAVLGDSEAWPLFEAVTTFNSLSGTAEEKLVDQALQHLDAGDIGLESALSALELISNKNPDVLRRGNTTHVTLITKLLAITEISDTGFATRADYLKAMLQKTTFGDNNHGQSPILHVIQENLEVASPQSLSIDTLIEQAKPALDEALNREQVVAIFPNPDRWSEALLPLSEQSPSPALAVMRPFAGAVFAANKPSTERAPRKASRDINGYSVALRMAMYTSKLAPYKNFQLLPLETQIELLYLLLITAELACDQIDLAEDNKLFGSHSNPEALTDVRDFFSDSQLCISAIVLDATSSKSSLASSAIDGLASKFFVVTSSATPTAFYAAKALSRFLPKLEELKGWHEATTEQWLADLGILKASTSNGLGAVAVLIGLQDYLSTSKLVSNLCNRLISDVAGASAQADTTPGLLILLNSCLAIYDEGDLPVAQNRIVFAVKQILSWTPNLATTDSQLASEACRALQVLLPAMKEVYGSYWETSLAFCISVWNATEGDLTPQSIPMVGMALKLFTKLRSLTEANDDLEDALALSNVQISQSLIRLLKLQRSKDTLSLNYVDDLLSRNVSKIPVDQIKDLSDFYPLVASDFRTIQSAAFDVLNKALPATQQQLSLDVLLEKTDARLPEELLSLLLDAPVFSNYPDDILVDFPTSVRGYLLSWHLVYDAYSSASYKVRSDYSDVLKSENYIEPLLEFVFDALGHSTAHAINLDKAHIDAQMIRSYDMWQAADSESNERNMQWLLVNLYYQCLKYTPNLAKTWWVDCKSKQTRIAAESWTDKFFSPLVIADIMDDVMKWAEEQEPPADDEKELIVKVSKKSREILAGYEVDDMMMQMMIRLPTTYPLEGVKVVGVNRVAVNEKKWASWMMVTQGVITFSHGNITDGLATFRRNVTGALKGQTECAICYSIISSDRKMPDKRCQTCKNLFHASCLFKWFASSNQSTCPLCRNPFNYGVSRGARS
ncbi:RING-type E3 ubiquitin transferase listerin [Hyphodiscus hymeniophilus]|uniref:E3 ubiquitin-protein ligase listerin n=1 Tax=Hyphodiscus hymeniophilus TaxID=353542 RepID=A0A9P7AXW2_9HELO|nr:RING-type E3 ubiquitin transferase listerin [Hyphodiscus hymeniophilus]